MSQSNPEMQTEGIVSNRQGQLSKEDVLGQIQQLKKAVIHLQRRHLIKSRSTVNQEKDSNEQLKQRASSNKMSSSSRLSFGNDFKQEINLSFRSRHLNQHSKGIGSHTPSILEKEEDEKSIIDAFKVSGSNLVSEKPDSEEEEPARTQLFTPLPRSREPQSSEFHFKKVDLIPNIEEENNKFYSYMKTYREKKASSLRNRFKKELPSTATSQQPSASQPQIESHKVSSPNIVDQFLKINLNKTSSKEEILQTGQTILKHFLGCSQVPNFTIKKYKNCVVFSLMPQQTKAAVWYYTRQLYFGIISLTEQGRVQRNGSGVEWVQGRHFYQGHFVNGQKNGRGKITYQNRDEYDGQWLDGQIYGFGRFTEWKNKKKYEGFWRNGQFCGQAPKDPFDSEYY